MKYLFKLKLLYYVRRMKLQSDTRAMELAQYRKQVASDNSKNIQINLTIYLKAEGLTSQNQYLVIADRQ